MSLFLRTPDGRRLTTPAGGTGLYWGPDELVYGPDAIYFGTPSTLGGLYLITAPRFVPDPEAGDIPREAPRYSVDLCTGFRRVAVAEAYTFRGVRRFLATGEWSFSAPLSGVSWPDAANPNPDVIDSILVWDETYPARIVFAGLTRRVGGVEGGRTRILTADDDSVEWTGVDQFGLLGQRQAWPTPGTNPPWADGYDVRSGVGSTVAAAFIEANAGAAALPQRRITGLTTVNAGVGTSSTWSGRLQPLDELVGRICRESGAACIPEMSVGLDEFRYVFRAPVDSSDRIVLTDQGDLEEMSRLVAPAEATYVIGAGQGELDARAFAVADSGATGIDRVEMVYENTNVSTPEGLQTAATTELALSGEDISVDGVVAADAAQRIRYIDDYVEGDWLGVEVAGVRYRSQVEAVVFELTPERDIVRPVLGRASTNDLLTLVRDVAGLQARFDRQVA